MISDIVIINNPQAYEPAKSSSATPYESSKEMLLYTKAVRLSSASVDTREGYDEGGGGGRLRVVT